MRFCVLENPTAVKGFPKPHGPFAEKPGTYLQNEKMRPQRFFPSKMKRCDAKGSFLPSQTNPKPGNARSASAGRGPPGSPGRGTVGPPGARAVERPEG